MAVRNECAPSRYASCNDLASSIIISLASPTSQKNQCHSSGSAIPISVMYRQITLFSPSLYKFYATAIYDTPVKRTCSVSLFVVRQHQQQSRAEFHSTTIECITIFYKNTTQHPLTPSHPCLYTSRPRSQSHHHHLHRIAPFSSHIFSSLIEIHFGLPT